MPVLPAEQSSLWARFDGEAVEGPDGLDLDESIENNLAAIYETGVDMVQSVRAVGQAVRDWKDAGLAAAGPVGFAVAGAAFSVGLGVPRIQKDAGDLAVLSAGLGLKRLTDRV